MKLEFDGIQFQYTENQLLSGIYVRCESGKVTGLLGRNGSGKSTLLKIVFGSLRADVVSVRIDDDHVPHPAFLKRTIAYLPQNSFIPTFLSLRQILKLYKIREELITTHFPELERDFNKKRNEVSGGTVRLFENLLILFSPSMFCFLDEPFTGLSPVMIESLINCIHAIKSSKGILITDHMYKHVVSTSDELFLLSNGKTYRVKDPDDLILRGYLMPPGLS